MVRSFSRRHQTDCACASTTPNLLLAVLVGAGWCWGCLSLTQRRKDAKGKSRDLSQRLQQARSTTGSLVLPSAYHQRSISGPVLAVWLCGLLLCELGALARNPLFGGSDWCRGCLSLTQRRKDAKGKCRNLWQGLLQARSTTGSLVLPSAFHQRPSAVRF